MIKPSKLRKSRRLQRQRRHARIRKRMHGTGDRPRLAVHRSIRDIQGRLIGDDAGRNLVGLSTRAREWRDAAPDGGSRKVEAARAAGRLLAERACEQGVTRVVFDRGGFRYHGRVRAFAEGARAGGLSF